MDIFKILQQKSKWFYIFLALLGLTNAIWNNALLLLITHKVNGTPLPYFDDQAFGLFILLIVTSYFVSRYFQLYMLKLSINISYEMGISIFRKVRFASFERFVKFGKEKIYALMMDTQTISDFPSHFIDTFNALIIFIVCLVYLFTISFWGTFCLFMSLAVLGVIYYFKTREAERYMKETRELADHYHRTIGDLINGFKEIKMSTVKSDNLFQFMNRNRLAVKTLNVKTSIKWLNNDLMGRYFWYILVGIILFVLPYFFKLDAKIITNFMVSLLFLMGPVGTLIGVIPYYTNIRIAVNRLRKFEEEIDLSELGAIDQEKSLLMAAGFEKLSFKGVVYRYSTENGDQEFSVGIDDLVFHRGETVFITGGNGSGKTTFINMLVGVVRPTEGSIFFNNTLIDNEGYAGYRNRISAIFSDSYLFTENYGDSVIREENEELMDYISMMKLRGIIKINSDRNKLEVELSKGQQKRLCMIYALLEKKDILVLDEWAADQDPHFRRYFYQEFLPVLRSMGKTIIMVTHDDFYYECTDRIIKFDYGRIISDKVITENIKQLVIS